MGIRTRAGYYGVNAGVEPREFFRTRRMVADLLGMPVPGNKAEGVIRRFFTNHGKMPRDVTGRFERLADVLPGLTSLALT